MKDFFDKLQVKTVPKRIFILKLISSFKDYGDRK